MEKIFTVKSTPIFILIYFTGLLRDFLFKNINVKIKFKQGFYDYDWSHSILEFLTPFSENNLVVLKWILTAVFTLFFWGLSYLLIHTIFKSHAYLSNITYLTIVFISVLIYAFFYLTNLDNYQGYLIVRKLMGIAQSPIPLLLLIPYIYFFNSPSKI